MGGGRAHQLIFRRAGHEVIHLHGIVPEELGGKRVKFAAKADERCGIVGRQVFHQLNQRADGVLAEGPEVLWTQSYAMHRAPFECNVANSVAQAFAHDALVFGDSRSA